MRKAGINQAMGAIYIAQSELHIWVMNFRSDGSSLSTLSVSHGVQSFLDISLCSM